MLRLLPAIAILIGLLSYSCSDDLFESSQSTGDLEFSRDTVYLDTIFTNISSRTRSFKVYNRSNNNISIPKVSLGKGESSFFRLNVNGSPGKVFENVEIFARDSIYVFIEATVDFNAVSDPLYTDQIIFDEGPNQQEVELVTLVQDAYFLYPQRDSDGLKETIVIGVGDDGEEIEVEGFYLDGNQVWTDEKPYVIYGFAGVNQGNQLVIEKGARVYFHRNSGLLVEENGSLQVNGTLDEKVVFQGDRLEEFYRDIPGQWSTILLKSGSRDIKIEHAVIKNNSIGILADSIVSNSEWAVRLDNIEIYNTSSFGVLARSTRMLGSNLLIANNGSSSLALTEGGSYRLAHSTFANYWSSAIRTLPAVLISNLNEVSQGSSANAANTALIQADFENCIIEGNQNIEFLLEKEEGSDFNFNFSHSLLRFDDPGGIFAGDPLYDFDNEDLYQNNIFNGTPDFLDIDLGDYHIGENSQAILLGDPAIAEEFPFDLDGIDRRNTPDSGAYQHLIQE